MSNAEPISNENLNACPFCAVVEGRESIAVAELAKGRIESRILARRGGAVAIAGLGPLRPGYVLVLPKRAHHSPLSLLGRNDLADVESLSQEFAAKIRSVFNTEVVMFEHGTLQDGVSSGMCISHAHLHLWPTDRVELPDLDLEYCSLQGLQGLRDIVRSYVYVKDNFSARAYFPASDQPSQFMRRVMASLDGHPDRWDWALYPNIELLIETVNLLHE